MKIYQELARFLDNQEALSAYVKYLELDDQYLNVTIWKGVLCEEKLTFSLLYRTLEGVDVDFIVDVTPSFFGLNIGVKIVDSASQLTESKIFGITEKVKYDFLTQLRKEFPYNEYLD